MGRLGIFQLPPLEGILMLVYRRVPGIKFTGIQLQTRLERRTVSRVKYLAQEHNIMSPVRALTRTPRRTATAMKPSRLP